MEILQFKPILKTIVWGGEKIAPFKGIKTLQDHIGESWELSGVPGNESIVDGGPFDGKSLTELVKEFKGRLVGEKVHPDDALAARLHGPEFNGKTEMWYVVDAAPGAHLFSRSFEGNHSIAAGRRRCALTEAFAPAIWAKASPSRILSAAAKRPYRSKTWDDTDENGPKRP